MLRRKLSRFQTYRGPAPQEALQLENEGHCVLRGVFEGDDLKALREEVQSVYDNTPGDVRAGIPDAKTAAMFRYEIFNRSARCQTAMAHPRILEVLYPLLGHDCHAINSPAWRNPPGLVCNPAESYFWHVDAGPHVPRPANVEWPEQIPYPIFVVAAHTYLQDCNLDDGPTTVIPRTHRTGQQPPDELRFDQTLMYRGQRGLSHIAKAGDVGFFVSDVWHRRRLPTAASKGRFFIQTNYGRRDIAQRILSPDRLNHASDEASARATTKRQRQLIGLHDPAFYDG